MSNRFVLVASLDTLHQDHALSCSVRHHTQTRHGLTPIHKLQAWRQVTASVDKSNQLYTPGVASLLTVVPQEQFASVLLLVRLAAAMLPTPKLAGVRLPACTGPLNWTCAVKKIAPVVLLDAVVPAGTQESVDVKVIVGVGWKRVFMALASQVQPATAVAVGLGDAAAIGLAEVPACTDNR